MAERLVNGRRGDASLLYQRARGGNRMLHECPVDLQGGCRRPAETANLVSVLVRQIKELLRCFHSLGGGDDDGLGEEI